MTLHEASNLDTELHYVVNLPRSKRGLTKWVELMALGQLRKACKSSVGTKRIITTDFNPLCMCPHDSSFTKKFRPSLPPPFVIPTKEESSQVALQSNCFPVYPPSLSFRRRRTRGLSPTGEAISSQ